MGNTPGHMVFEYMYKIQSDSIKTVFHEDIAQGLPIGILVGPMGGFPTWVPQLSWAKLDIILGFYQTERCGKPMGKPYVFYGG